MAKVAIVGHGAMGSGYVALMVGAGQDVHAVTLWPDHAEATARHGLRVEGASGNRTVRLHAATTTGGIGPRELVVVAIKAFDVEAAARLALPLLGPDTVVQMIQNGPGSAERVAPIVGADRFAVGVVGGDLGVDRIQGRPVRRPAPHGVGEADHERHLLCHLRPDRHDHRRGVRVLGWNAVANVLTE